MRSLPTCISRNGSSPAPASATTARSPHEVIRAMPSTAAASRRSTSATSRRPSHDLETAVASDRKYDFHRAIALLAHAYAHTGRAAEADALFQEVTAASTLSETYLNYATFLASQNRTTEAREWAQRILAKKPTMPRYLQRRERPWFRKASALLKRLSPMTGGHVTFRTCALVSGSWLRPLSHCNPPHAAATGDRRGLAVLRTSLAEYRPAPRQPHGRGRRAPQPSVHVLHGAGERWRLEDDRRRPHLEADLRRPADRLDRRHRRRAIGSERRVRRQRGRPAPAGPLDRRRRLQVDRRRQDLDERRLERRAADSRTSPSIRGMPTASVRRGPRPSLRTERRARHLPLDRRRPHVSRRCSTRTRTPAATTSTSIRPIPTSSTRRCGKSGRGRGRTRVWAGTGGGIFKSTDGGTTWRQLTNGLPRSIQANLAISPANPKRIFAAVAGAPEDGLLEQARGNVGIYRSDDAGESWKLITQDTRPTGRIGGGDLPMPIPHPTESPTCSSRRARCRGSQPMAA